MKLTIQIVIEAVDFETDDSDFSNLGIEIKWSIQIQIEAKELLNRFDFDFSTI